MQMRENETLLCEAIAKLKNNIAYLKDVREYKKGFSLDMGKAVLNAIDLRGIEKVVCNNHNLHELLEKLRFEKKDCAFSLLLKGYFSTNCETF